MISFYSDYTETCHPAILKRLADLGMEQFDAYGTDVICDSAKAKIMAACGRKPGEDLDVQFVVGGTQANKLVIRAALRPYHGVIAADNGHINTHESGAIEAMGHKVLTVKGVDGKICPDALDALCHSTLDAWDDEHIVLPGMVYISCSTELGTVYTRSEIDALRKVCDKYGIYLYLDGARLGYAMASGATDIDFKYLADTCDAFYIGGTKQGGMIGEAIVIRNDDLKPHFLNIVKQTVGRLAKGWMIGVQFDVLFTDNLYLEIAKNAVDQAKKIKEGLTAMGVEFDAPGSTNMLYPIFKKEIAEYVTKTYNCNPNRAVNDEMASIRLCTSWATKPEYAEAFLEDMKNILK